MIGLIQFRFDCETYKDELNLFCHNLDVTAFSK